EEDFDAAGLRALGRTAILKDCKILDSIVIEVSGREGNRSAAERNRQSLFKAAVAFSEQDRGGLVFAIEGNDVETLIAIDIGKRYGDRAKANRIGMGQCVAAVLLREENAD